MAKLPMDRDLVLNLLSSLHRELAVYMGSTLQRMQKVEISTRTLVRELLMWWSKQFYAFYILYNQNTDGG
jgi:hypothetical protein